MREDFFDVGAQLHRHFLLVGFIFFLNRFNVIPEGVIRLTKTGVGVLHPVVFVVFLIGTFGVVFRHGVSPLSWGQPRGQQYLRSLNPS